MCGIVGIVGQAPVTDRLMEGLSRLEYRGYDSAGIAVSDGGAVKVHRAVGKLDNLKSMLAGGAPAGCVGIGHTRWATHGCASESNAHPHRAGSVTLVHNGIIENHEALRMALQARGVVLRSETDTEVAAAWLNQMLCSARTLDEAFLELLRDLRGSYALARLY